MQKIKTYAFADEASAQIDLQIAAMRRNRMSGLEIRNVDGENVSDISLEKAREVRKKLDDAGLITWSIGSPLGKIGIADDFAPHLEKTKHILEIADVLGAKNIRIFSFYIPQEKDADLYRNAVIDRLAQMVELTKGTDILMCHENEKGIFGDMADRCLQIHQAIGELGGIFDPANFVQCGQDTAKAWEMLKPFVTYLHIKDALPDGTVVPAGEGAGNLREILAQYKGNAVTLEPHLSVFEGLDKLEGGEKSIVGNRQYPSHDAAFDAAAQALQGILEELQ